MKIIIEYKGNTYVGVEEKGNSAKDITDFIYAQFNQYTKFKMELEGGGFIIIGEHVLRSCVMKIIDT